MMVSRLCCQIVFVVGKCLGVYRPIFVVVMAIPDASQHSVVGRHLIKVGDSGSVKWLALQAG